MLSTAIGLTIFFAATQSASSDPCSEVVVPTQDIVRGEKGQEAHRFLQEKAVEGFSGAVLISDNGEIVLKRGYGYANRQSLEPNTSSTLFNTASVSKIFTSAVILDLEERQKLSLDSPLDTFFGEFPEPKSTATVHHLLTHTAGLVVRGAELDYRSRDLFVASVKNAAIEASPGAEFRYTNAGYVMLAAVAETVSGEPFEDVLNERIFGPACMNSTAFAWDDDIKEQPSAVGYAGKTLETLRPSSTVSDIWGNRGPSNISSNVGDLYRWITALKERRVISESSIDKAFTAYVGDEGYGWHVIETNHGRLVRRGGGLPGFESSLRWYIDKDVVIIILINNHVGFRVPVVEGLEDIVLDQAVTVR